MKTRRKLPKQKIDKSTTLSDEIKFLNNTLLIIINQLSYSITIQKPNKIKKSNFMKIDRIKKENQISFLYDEWCVRNKLALELAHCGYWKVDENSMNSKEVKTQLKINQILHLIEIIENETIMKFSMKNHAIEIEGIKSFPESVRIGKEILNIPEFINRFNDDEYLTQCCEQFLIKPDLQWITFPPKHGITIHSPYLLKESIQKNEKKLTFDEEAEIETNYCLIEMLKEVGYTIEYLRKNPMNDSFQFVKRIKPNGKNENWIDINPIEQNETKMKSIQLEKLSEIENINGNYAIEYYQINENDNFEQPKENLYIGKALRLFESKREIASEIKSLLTPKQYLRELYEENDISKRHNYGKEIEMELEEEINENSNIVSWNEKFNALKTETFKKKNILTQLNRILIHVLFTLNYQFKFQQDLKMYSPSRFLTLKTIYHKNNVLIQFASIDISKNQIEKIQENQIKQLLLLLKKELNISVSLKNTEEESKITLSIIMNEKHVTWNDFCEKFSENDNVWLDILRYSYKCHRYE